MDSDLVFTQSYFCMSFSHADRPFSEDGDKIIMPPSALDRLAGLMIDFPMLFEIQNPSVGRISHCGVLEFSAEEGIILVPRWMMENMRFEEGDIAEVKSASLRRGSYVKLQPHTKEFIELSNPKAVLETKLRNFSCLSTGDTIMISHGNKKFYIDVVETKPSSAVSIIETDCEVDFAPPLDYVEPEKPAESIASKRGAATAVEESREEEPKFRPFGGTARRLDGRPPTTRMSATTGNSTSNDAPSTVGSRKHSGKLVFGSERAQINPGRTEKINKDDAEDGTPEKKFLPFTGKKYTLAG
ncbi:hypothetical protein U1Q18_038652 [Sarracenia purpurea var. burkii]